MLPVSSSIRSLSFHSDIQVCGIATLLVTSLMAFGCADAVSSELAQQTATEPTTSEPQTTESQKGTASIHLTDGSVIKGTVSGIRDDQIRIKTAFSDDLRIDVGLVERLQWLKQTELLMDDSRVVVVPAIVVAEGSIDINGHSEPLEAIDIMNPAGWEEGKGYHWTGDASTAIAFNRGNTETDELDVKFNSVFTSKRDRFTVNTQYERDDTYNRLIVNDQVTRQKVVTANNWKVLGKYDFFLSDPRNYFGINTSLEADALAGVDLRTYAGPYIGRKLFDNQLLKLDGELGFTHVLTDYSDAAAQADNDYTGLNWNVTAESRIFGGDSRLYLRHVGIVDATDAEQLIVKNTFGAAFPLVYGLEGAAEVTINYDGTAAEGSEQLDQVYRLRVGYAW